MKASLWGSVQGIGAALSSALVLAIPGSAQVTLADGGTISLERVLTIGSLDGPDALSLIGPTVVARDGSFIVSQPQEGSVRIYASDGRLVHVLGSVGQGPGEFEAIGSVSQSGDSVHVFDPRAQRLTTFGPEGALLETRPIRIQGVRSVVVNSYLPDGPRGAVVGAEAVASRPQDRRPLVAYWMTVNTDGHVLDTIGAFHRPEETLAILTDRGGWFYTAQPFTTSPRLILDPQLRAWSVQRTDGDLARLDRPGGPQQTFVNDLPREPLTDDLLDETVSSISGRLGTRVRGAVARVREELEVPDSLPAVSHALAAYDGVVWLQSFERDRWWLVSTETRTRYSVQAPPGLIIRGSSGETVWAIRYGELDEPYVELYRIVDGPFSN